MKGGKVIMDSFINEPAQRYQIVTIGIFAEAMETFTNLFTQVFVRHVVQLDHTASDTSLFFIEQARNAGQVFADASTELIEILRNQEVLMKETYYKALFTVQETLLPAVRNLEQLFGDELTNEGSRFSEVVSEFLQVA
jgi:phage tail sheath protein FI